MPRPDHTTPAHVSSDQIPLGPCRIVGLMRRIWSVDPSKVNHRTWRWLTTEPLF